MRRYASVITLLIGILLVSPAVFAGGAQETDRGEFLDRLEPALENSQFTEEEVQAIMDSAEQYSWENVADADAEMIARALSQTKENQAGLSPERNAELAHELAQNAVRLKAENYDDTVVAQATLEAVRSMLQQIEVWRERDRTENLGELVRATVSTEARKAAQQRAAEQQEKRSGGKDGGKDKSAEATQGNPAAEKAGSSEASQ